MISHDDVVMLLLLLLLLPLLLPQKSDYCSRANPAALLWQQPIGGEMVETDGGRATIHACEKRFQFRSGVDGRGPVFFKGNIIGFRF